MAQPSHTTVCKSFCCLCSCVLDFSSKWPRNNQNIHWTTSQIFALCMASYVGIKGLQDLTLPSQALPPTRSGVCNLRPEQRGSSFLKGFAHLTWPAQKTQACLSSTWIPSPFWLIASPLQGLSSAMNILGSLPSQEWCSHHWAEPCASAVAEHSRFSSRIALVVCVLNSCSVCLH